ncbi:hypothetical protein Tco_0733007 [Tanacetum coccineum]
MLRTKSSSGRGPNSGPMPLEKTRGKENAEEVFTINHERPNQGREELASIMGYMYKCFLRLAKEYNQIRMAEDDKEKTRFHMEEGVYCFTYMPKEGKNSAATL